MLNETITADRRRHIDTFAAVIAQGAQGTVFADIFRSIIIITLLIDIDIVDPVAAKPIHGTVVAAQVHVISIAVIAFFRAFCNAIAALGRVFRPADHI